VSWWVGAEDDRHRKIAQLMDAVPRLKDKSNQRFEQSELWLAIHTLGTLRAEASVDLLLDLIDLEMPPFLLDEVRRPSDREVIAVLAKIGKPASIAAVNRLFEEKSTSRARACLRVVYLVEGPEIGRFILETAARKEANAEKKDRMEKAIELFSSADKVVP
jgi:hypothetical protein